VGGGDGGAKRTTMLIGQSSLLGVEPTLSDTRFAPE
jgi:hypothetical protein